MKLTFDPRFPHQFGRRVSNALPLIPHGNGHSLSNEHPTGVSASLPCIKTTAAAS
jgi:hypothetical protein